MLIFGAEGTCDCEKLTVEVVKQNRDQATVRVSEANIHDDSIKDTEYLVTVTRTADGSWAIKDATYAVTCRRGVAEKGICT